MYDSDARIFTLISWSGISLWPFRSTAKALLYEKWKHCLTTGTSPLWKYTEEQQARLEQGSSPGQVQWPDGLLHLWVHQIKTPLQLASSWSRCRDTYCQAADGAELFKIDSCQSGLQYLRLESFHDDLVLKRVSLEDLVKEVVRKYALFYPKNLTVNLPWFGCSRHYRSQVALGHHRATLVQ